MATEAPPPDGIDPSHVLPADDWAAVEAEREWIEQMKSPLDPAELAALTADEEGDGDVVQS